jgi:hypothetical protein
MNDQNWTWTVREIFDRICTCKTDDEAEAFFDEYVEYMRYHATGLAANVDPVSVVRSNIGYIGGYGAPYEIVERFQRVAQAFHPVFGASSPTAEQAMEMGKAMGRALHEPKR